MINRFKRLHAAMFDRGTIHGNFFMIVVTILVCLFMWNLQDISIWFDVKVLGRDAYRAELLSEGELRTRRFWAGALFAVSFFVHVVALFMAVYEKLRRRRAKKSAQGQWYDTANLTKEDLYADKDVDDEPK